METNNVKTVIIKISSIEDVKEFNSAVLNYTCNTTLCSGRYRVDVKSIMRIFSLDLSKPIELVLEKRGICDDRDELCKALKALIVD